MVQPLPTHADLAFLVFNKILSALLSDIFSSVAGLCSLGCCKLSYL